MTVKNLENIDFDEIIACLLLAFNNYFVEMPTSSDFYRKRWKYAKVDLKFSYGMFENEKLVGFIINAIDTRNGVLTAYNTGTGVIPEFRRRNSIKKIYAYAIPKLKANGIEKCLLEAITANTIAIKVYENIGFSKTRTLKCFSGELISSKNNITLIEKKVDQIDFKILPNQDNYTWDNHKNSLQSNPVYKFFQIESDAKMESYFIINSQNGYVAQFDVINTNRFSWNTLFYGIERVSKKIKINNVDSKFQEKIEALKSFGMENTIDQYEMEMML